LDVTHRPALHRDLSYWASSRQHSTPNAILWARQIHFC